MTEIHTEDHIKSVREALCVAQAAILNFPDRPTNWGRYTIVLANLLIDIDRQRPIGSDGKHGNLHTDTCGCEDKDEFETEDRSISVADAVLLFGKPIPNETRE